MKKALHIKDKTVTIYHPDNYTNDTPVFYMISLGEEDDSNIYNLVSSDNLILVSIEVLDWNSELSPWFSKKVFPKGEDFKGDAGKLLELIEKDIVIEAEKTLSISPNRRILIGYSLAGLFALWSGYKTTIFKCLGSVSGSLWFDGFAEYVKNNSFIFPISKVYLSLGDKESNTKNPITSKVKECTSEIELLYKKSNISTLFEMNPGNHFQEVSLRISKAIRYLKD